MSGVQFSNRHEENSVLIVNDVPEQLSLMDTLLRRAGYSVLTAEDGLEAFKLAKENHPDLVISDVCMPRVGGLEFCRLMRADTQLRSVPILLVSAVQHDTASIVDGLRAGADDYLDVPFDSTRLVAKVARLLERSRLEANYRDLVEQASDLIFTQDLSGLLTSINTAGARFVGRDPQKLLGESFFSVFGLPGLDPNNNGFKACLDHPEAGQEFRHQFIAKRVSGEERWLDLTISPIRDRMDETVGFRGLARDITERKQVELALQQSAIEWRQTFNAIDFPVLIVDLEGRITRSNEAAEHSVGAEEGELVGQSVAGLGTGQPWKTAAEWLERIREIGFPVSQEVTDETTGKTWSLALFLVHEFGSRGARAILIAQDITKKTELEASLRQSKMMSLLGSVVAGVAHEVRNPLFAISAILDTFETRFFDRTEYQRYTSVLRSEIERLTVLMEELLEYGKPFRGDVYPASVEEMISRSIRACLPAAEAAHVTLVNNVTQGLPRIMVDRRRLSRVFINLIGNAIQHSPSDGRVTVEAYLGSDGNQEWIECAIKDLGPGIQDEDLPNIFEPFFTKRRGGTGLGLAIAQKTMEEHGGKLLAGNNPEGGACMIARFPLPTKVSADG
jgi:PAS domain S-box-containing protein